MPLVSMTDVLKKAKAGKYAVGQYNINNLEWTYAVLEAAQEKNAPVILGVSEGAAKYMGGFKTIVGMVKGLMDDLGVTVDVIIHLDHGQSFESCKSAIDAGFTSVMIDGSHHPISENLEITKKVVDYAHANGASVEAEVGTVGGNEDGVIGGVNYADFDECKTIVEQTGIDCLAPALGSVHGDYHGEPNLGWAEMEKLNNDLDIPLVLHGGSGIPEDQIKKAINLGHAKINVNTENQQAFAKVVREVLASEADAYDPRVFLKPAREAIKRVVVQKIVEFGSDNKN